MDRWKKTGTFICAFLLLALVCIFPLLGDYISSFSHTVAVAPGEKIDLQNGVTVSQTLYLQGRLKELQIYLSIGPDVSEDETIVFSFSQNGDTKELRLRAGDMPGYQGYYDLSELTGHAIAGWAAIEIKAEGKDAAPALSVWLGNDAAAGLPSMQIGEESAEKCMALSFTIRWRPDLFLSRTGLLAICALLCAAASYLIFCRREWLEKHNWSLVAATFFMIMVVICIRQPTMSFKGEPVAEAAYDFWQGQTENGFWKSLMRLESGLYLSWAQRIVTMLAVHLFPRKYVFVGMQMLMLAILSGSCSFFCAKSFRRFFHPYIQVLISLFMGIFIWDLPFYGFNCLGYWGIFFILLFCLYGDMENYPRWFFYSGLAISAIFCLSKLLYAALIPTAVFLLIVSVGKKRSRFKLYWVIILLANLFHVAYVFYCSSSSITARTGLGSFSIPPLFRLAENLIYYQVEFLIAALTGHTFRNGLFVNAAFLLVLCAIIVTLLLRLFRKGRIQTYAVYMLSCLITSFGVLGIDILSGAGTTDMSAKVNWNVNFSGNNQHYLFCYASLLAMLIGALYIVSHRPAYLSFQNAHPNERRVVNAVSAGLILALCMQFAPLPGQGYYTSREEFPTEWQQQWQVTENESYYLPINTGPFALISMRHNSLGVLIGYDTSGIWRQLPVGSVGLDEYRTYYNGSVEALENLGIISLTVRKANSNFRSSYMMRLYDASGQIIAEVLQSNSDNRQWLTFLPDEPIYGAVWIEFVSADSGAPAYVRDALNIGIEYFGQ